MARFLLTFVHTPLNEVPLFVKAFRLKSAHSPDEVSIPENTMIFAFVEADTNSPEELASSFVTLKLGNFSRMSSSVNFHVENDKFYVVGKRVYINDIEVIYNEKLHAYIPVNLLDENYEVVDM